MQGMHWLVVSVLVFVVSGCDWRRNNPYYCPPGTNCEVIPDPEKCGTEVCPVEMPLCLNETTCVECIGNKGCLSPQFCSAQNTCIECTKHDDCADSKLCLSDGACARPDEVAYVGGGTAPSTTCTLDMPCENLEEALLATPARKYIKVTGMIIDDKPGLIEGREVAIYGVANAQLDRTNNGPILHVRGPGSIVSVYDLEITGQSGTGGTDAAVRLEAMGGKPTLSLSRVRVTNNAGRGVLADGGSLTITQSTISLNTSGGISIATADFDIVNNVIVKNGSAGSTFGGVRIDAISGAGTRRFEFNTVAQNLAVSTGLKPGVACTAVSTPLELKNSIVYDNNVLEQVEGSNCSWSYSDIGPMGAPGTRNINMPPLFVDPAGDNYHLQAGSPAKDMADVTPTVKSDIDGDTRPQGNAPDMGADEVQ